MVRFSQHLPTDPTDHAGDAIHHDRLARGIAVVLDSAADAESFQRIFARDALGRPARVVAKTRSGQDAHADITDIASAGDAVRMLSCDELAA